MLRSFVAVDIDEEVRRRLAEVQGRLAATGADLKLVEPENIHVTMKFLGDVPESRLAGLVEALERSVAGEAKFNIGVKRIGVFPSLSYIRVVWAGVEQGSDELVKIQRKIDGELRSLGFPAERDFVPHLTIARVRTARMKEQLAAFVKQNAGAEFGVCRVQAVELKHSTLTPKGPIYGTITRVELA
jgi:2'-5' RNA ligase